MKNTFKKIGILSILGLSFLSFNLSASSIDDKLALLKAKIAQKKLEEKTNKLEDIQLKKIEEDKLLKEKQAILEQKKLEGIELQNKLKEEDKLLKEKQDRLKKMKEMRKKLKKTKKIKKNQNELY